MPAVAVVQSTPIDVSIVGEVEKAKRMALKAVGIAMETELMNGFNREVAPDDTPWAKLKHRQGKPLALTGTLKSSYRAVVTDGTVKLESNSDYAIYHQAGTRHIPARPMVPEGDLPPRWRRAVDAAIARAMKAAFK